VAAGVFQRSIGPKKKYFGGTLLCTHSQPGITISEVQYADARRCLAHTHELAFFSLLLDGGYREQFGRSELRYHPFSLGYHPAATTHTDEITAPGTRFLLIQLSGNWLQRMAEGESALQGAGPPHLCNAQGSWLATRLLREPLEAESAVLEMLSLLLPPRAAQAERQRPAWLHPALDLLRSEYTRKLTVMEVARRMDLHPVYFSRQFRAWCGQSIGDFVNRLRVCLAFEQMQRLEIPLSEIALRAGFADQSQFTKAFRRYHGATPGSVRKKLGGKTCASLKP
jgi:AraC-like DNA-binding protein